MTLSSPGGDYLAYSGVPADYPGWNELALEVSIAMAYAAEQMLDEARARDPLLWALTDDRCQLREWARYRAGALPLGTRIRTSVDYSGWFGTITSRWERQVMVTWEENHHSVTTPFIAPVDEVWALVPLPFDLSAIVEDR